MQAYLIVLLVVLIVVALVFAPLSLRARIYLNALKNTGVISVVLFGFITIEEFRFKITRTGIALLTPDSDEPVEPDEKMIFQNNLAMEALKIVRFRELSVFASLGQGDSALNTALYGGTALAVINSFLALLMTKRGPFRTCVSLSSDFVRDVCIFAVHLHMRISLISVLAAVKKARKKTKKAVEIHGREQHA